MLVPEKNMARLNTNMKYIEDSDNQEKAIWNVVQKELRVKLKSVNFSSVVIWTDSISDSHVMAHFNEMFLNVASSVNVQGC